MRPRLSFILVSYGLLALAGCFSAVMPDAMDLSTEAMAQTTDVPLHEVATPDSEAPTAPLR